MKLMALALPAVFWATALVGVRLAIVPSEHCGELTAVEARQAATAASEWLIAGQREDGSYLYEYADEGDQPPASYNIVRHAGVTMSLFQTAGRLESPEAMAAADRGVEWMLDRLVPHDDWLALSDNDEAKLGASALMAIALAERRLLTGEEQHDEVMQALGRFMASLQREDGGFHIKWLFDENGPELGTTSLYYPGEALWALALLHEAFPDEGFDEAAWAAADFITLRRDEVEDVKFPPLNDHWGAYGLAEMVEWGLADHHTDYARDLAGRFGFLVRVESQKEDNAVADAMRGDDRRAASLGTWVEGLAALWRLSSGDERLADLTNDIEERARCGSGILIQRQSSDGGQAEVGAWFAEGITRMDDQQHAISGLIYTADAIDGRVMREPGRP
jgi:hypothetical protein